MSYILDALRKADSERERGRGTVPGIHSGPPVPAAAPASPRGGNPALLVGAVVVLALLLGITLMRVWSAGDPPPAASAAPASVPPPTTAAGIPPPPAGETVGGGLPGVVQNAPNMAQAAQSSPSLAGAMSGPALPGATVAGGQPTARPDRLTAPLVPAPAAAPEHRALPLQAPSPTPPRAQASIPQAPASPVPSLNELPEAVRRTLPALAISGAMYSESPANRMLIVNGQLFHEGDEPLPGLKLEQIKLKSAVLNYRGQRYAVSY